MFFPSTLYGTLLAALFASSTPVNAIQHGALGRHRCGTRRPPAELLAEYGTSNVVRRDESRSPWNPPSIVVDTYFHIVTNSTSQDDGYLTDDDMARQLSQLNKDFAPSGIGFNLVDVTRTVSKVWATTNRSQEWDAMRRALRRGSYSALNIYFRTDVPMLDGDEHDPKDGYPDGFPDDFRMGGQCSLPEDIEKRPGAFYEDGCDILHDTVPRASDLDDGWYLGKTATHEVGHWFGLLHPFYGGCEGDGDFVADTPPQARPSSGCPINQTSCDPNVYDSYHNFMDYSDEYCQYEFTLGQAARMHDLWAKYRRGTSMPASIAVGSVRKPSISLVAIIVAATVAVIPVL